jgi:hypothetical protein
MKLGALFDLLQPWYLQIKFIHVMSAAVWAFSTAVAYRDYIVPVFLKWQAGGADAALVERRNWVMERFDHGAQLEHVAFPLLVLSGGLMAWLGAQSFDEVTWLTVKLTIVALVFVPMEIVDYYISHFGGNKARIRRSGDMAAYERMMGFHWLFFRVSTPLVIAFVPMIFYLAVVKPF